MIYWIMLQLHAVTLDLGAPASWYQANVETLSIIAGHVFVIARFISMKLKDVPVTGFIAYVKAIADFLALVRPETKADPLAAARAKWNAIPVTARPIQDDEGLAGPFNRREPADRPLLRRMVRKQAERQGFTVDDALVDDIIGQMQVEAGLTGPFQNLVKWFLENPETVAKIILMIMSFFAAKKDGAS